MRLLLVSLLATLALAGCSPLPTSPFPSTRIGDPVPTTPYKAAVLTHHNDNARTGLNSLETVLTPANLRSHDFCFLFSLPVEGQVYAQPLYMPDVPFPGGKRDVLLVATMRNRVYAFDAQAASTRKPLWTVQLGTPVPYNFMTLKDVHGPLGYNIHDSIGITSTPVIDPLTNTVYVVAKTCDDPDRVGPDRPCTVKNGNTFSYRLHALDLLQGQEKFNGPTTIQCSLTTDDSTGVPRTVVFAAAPQLQRAALLLANNRVYLAFASHQDAAFPLPSWGWLIAYAKDDLSAPPAAFCTTPTGNDGGIGQAGSGPASDEAGNIYVSTGNGTFGVCGLGQENLSSSVVKLSPDLKLLSWFAPAYVSCLNERDADLGSGGPMLLPRDSFGGRRLLLAGGKEGVVYLLDRDDLGGRQQQKPPDPAREAPCPTSLAVSPPVELFQAAPLWDHDSTSAAVPSRGYHHVNGSLVLWRHTRGAYVYLWAERDALKQFQLASTSPVFRNVPEPGTPDWADAEGFDSRKGVVKAGHGMPGGFLSVTSNGLAFDSGVVWASLPAKRDWLFEDAPGVLRAFDADTLQLLWENASADKAPPYEFATFCPPTVANGRVFLATFSNRVDVYGIRK
jgi:outer membrane protein assembly factor BamB